MSNARRLLFIAPIVVLAACVGGTPSPPGSPAAASAAGSHSQPPTEGPSAASSDSNAIDHPSGSADVVLRYEEGGGFINPAFSAASTPLFTLYGDGRVLARDPAVSPPAAEGSVARQTPLSEARLNESDVQALLRFALTEGGLGTARARYDHPLVADAPTATFTIHAGGLDKTVAVTALGFDTSEPNLPDAPARATFQKLAGRLLAYAGAGGPYHPERLRAVLTDTGGFVAADARPWPWSDLKPRDFKVNPDPNAMSLPSRVLSSSQVDALHLKSIDGGFSGLSLIGPGDGKTYSLTLRPLLPDESS